MKTAVLISTLIAFFFSASSIARANPVVTDGKAAVADTAKVKKERVKKEPSQTKRNDFDDAVYAGEQEEEPGFWAACLGSLCGSFLESICSSIGSDDSDYEEESHISEVDEVYTYENDTDLAYYPGKIEPVDPEKNSVDLWDKPGGYEADGFVLGNLQRDTEVTVIRFYYYKNTPWALVTSNEPGSVEGWIVERDMVPLSEEEAPDTEYLTSPTKPSTSTISSTYVRESPKFVFLAEFSYPVFANKSISEEYRNNAYRLGAEVGLFVSKTVSITFSFGYLHSNGEPLYDYVAPGLRDSPQDSKLQVLSYGLQFGQLIFFKNNSAFFSYGLGPTVFDVRESAWIREYENDILVGERTEELSKWKVGGEVRVASGFIVAGKVSIGFSVRYSLIPWESDEEKSLTLDYLDSNSISIFDFGISIGYLLF